MGAGGEWYLALGRIDTTATTTAVQWQDARSNPDVAEAVGHGLTLDDDDDSSKQTPTMMTNRSHTGTCCQIN